MPENIATQYITITKAEYVYLQKQAAMLEMIIKDQTYNRETVAAAVALWLSMNDLREVGADQ